MGNPILRLLLFLIFLSALASVASRLLGIRQSWRRGLLTAFGGVIVGGVTTVVLYSLGKPPPGTVPTSFIVRLVPVAVLATMAIAVALELLSRNDHRHAGRQPATRLPHPLRAIRRWAGRERHYGQISWIVLRQGLSPYLRGGRAPITNGRFAGRSSVWGSLRGALGEAGGVFIKLGQVLSTRADLLPPAAIAWRRNWSAGR